MQFNLVELLFYGLIGGLFSLIGGLCMLWRSEALKPLMMPLIAFAAGSFLAVSFLDLMPEAIEAAEKPHAVFGIFLVGVSVVFALERFLMKYYRKHNHEENGEHKDHTESLPLLIILGDSLHNFLDGVVIALAYIANPALGLPTALAVSAHEIPQEIGDFAILLDRGWSKTKVLLANIFSSLMTLVGIALALVSASFFEGRLAYLLAGVSGIFAYIALSDLIPELHHRAGHRHFFRVILAFLTGLILVWYLISKTHGE